MMRRIAKKIQAEWDAEEERKRVRSCEETKDYTEETYISYTRKESNDEFLKRSRIQELAKIKSKPQMIEDFRKAQDRESLEAISMITDFKVIDSPDGEYLMIYRANTHFRAFDTLWEILHILNQEDWEIVRWRLNESSGVHTLELEDGTMIHMLTERRYPLSRELMIRMLDHGMEVEEESDIAITLIHLFILWTTEDGDDS
ncbi:hypothetical protein Tco_0910885 [Tanacetum coccineum]|uniref:Uncharacterized protein n=1 Tax=Tanacetum coccineum TaxID=301880 RepID=A0ABQ5CVA7_9ASTR